VRWPGDLCELACLNGRLLEHLGPTWCTRGTSLYSSIRRREVPPTLISLWESEGGAHVERLMQFTWERMMTQCNGPSLGFKGGCGNVVGACGNV